MNRLNALRRRQRLNQYLEVGLMIAGVILGIILFTWLAGRAFDEGYMQRCNRYKNCDNTAIRYYEKQGCEILGDTEGHRWAECDIR